LLAATRSRVYAPAFVISLLAVACGGGSEPASRPPAETPQPAASSTVDVVLNNFAVSVEPASVPAGKVTFNIQVEDDSHAFSVLRTDLPPDQLPLTDSGQADTLAPGIELVLAEGIGGDRSVEADLKPGSYVLICNDSAHYAEGMRAGLTVTG
jgi:uncharacterized cupredoxin-like copper-binding protein